MKARRLAPLLAVATIVIAAPATVQASSVQVFGPLLHYGAAPGEDNSLTVSQDGSAIRFSDPGAVISPGGPQCTSAGADAVCDPTGVISMQVFLGDLDDEATIASIPPLSSIQIFGEGGSDSLTGSETRAESLFGDTGIDPPGADNLNGRGGDDAFNGGPEGDNIVGGPGDDTCNGEPGDDVCDGGEGNDRLLGSGSADGADRFIGGPGVFDSASYTSRSAGITLAANNQADDGEPGEGDNIGDDVETLTGGNGDDLLLGGPSRSSANGNNGNDIVDGGESGDINLTGGNGDDVVRGGPGDDNSMAGNDGADEILGGPGDDVLFSEAGNDEPDVMRGGPGTDLVSYSAHNDPVVVTLDGRANDGVAAEGDNVTADVEDLIGSRYSDRLIGNRRVNELVGGEGRDFLRGGGGSDGLDGGRGADRLNAGPGVDTILGSAGADLIEARDNRADEISCGAAEDTVKADRRDRPRRDCERIRLPRR